MKNRSIIIVFTLILALIALAGGTVTATGIQQTSSLDTEKEFEESIKIPVDTVKRGKRGDEINLKTFNVPNGEYEVSVVAKNQGSVHPGNNIVVRSGESEVVIPDVESAAFAEATAEGSLIVTDGIVTLFLDMGEDEVFSGGVEVVLAKVVEEESATEPEPKEEPEVSDIGEGKGGGELESESEALPQTGMAVNASAAFAGISGLGYAINRIRSKIIR